MKNSENDNFIFWGRASENVLSIELCKSKPEHSNVAYEDSTVWLHEARGCTATAKAWRGSRANENRPQRAVCWHNLACMALDLHPLCQQRQTPTHTHTRPVNTHMLNGSRRLQIRTNTRTVGSNMLRAHRKTHCFVSHLFPEQTGRWAAVHYSWALNDRGGWADCVSFHPLCMQNHGAAQRESGRRPGETDRTRLTSATPSVSLPPPAGEAG